MSRPTGTSSAARGAHPAASTSPSAPIRSTPDRVNTFERWASREQLDAWRKVAAAPHTGIRFRSVSVMEYSVTGEGPPVFG